MASLRPIGASILPQHLNKIINNYKKQNKTNMKKSTKHFSCNGLTKSTVVLALAAVIGSPANAFAEQSQTPSAIVQTDQQDRQVKGNIIDEFGDPMIGVTVRVKGTKNAAITDFDGNFTVKAQPSDVIEISYIGYIAKSVKASETQLSIKMEPNMSNLDEVVVVGYGTVKRRDLTGAISQVKSAEIKEAPVLNPMEGLAGRVSGLDIVRESGKAGSGPQILLRGNRSLNASCAPLYVVDGITGGSIDDVNPNDIESIEVLKDASSTAIYGSAGANGVIIVTTKKGVEGKVSVDFDAYVGINTNPFYPSTLSGDAWVNYLVDQYEYNEYELTGELMTRANNPLYANGQLDVTQLFNSMGLTAGTVDAYNAGKWITWKDEVLQTGIQQNYNVSIRGGSDKIQSYMSAGYQQEKGVYKNDQVDKINFRAGSNYKFNDYVTVGFQSTLTYRNSESRNSRLSKSLNMMPLGDVYDENGNINKYPIADLDNINIIVDDQDGIYRNNRKNTYISVSPYVEIKPLKGLSFKSLFNAGISNSRTGKWDGMDTYMELTGSQVNTRSADYNTSNSWSYMWQNVLNYNFTLWKDHDITLTGITEYAKNYNESAALTAQDFPYDGFLWYNMTAGGTPVYGTEYSETAKMSYAARFNYSYLGRYLVSASIRWDGASQLYNKWDSFPAFALGWRVSDEPFMEWSQSWLDNLKFRLGYGVTGNANISPYVSLTSVTNSSNYVTFSNTSSMGYILAQNVANYDLTWEKSYNWNLGIDFSILRHRIDGSIELYTTDTKGVLYNRPLPTALGVYNAKNPYYKMSNIARIKNKGLEVTLNTRNIDTKNFKWNSTFTFSTNKEELTEINLGNNVTVDDLVALNLFIGEPVKTVYNYKKVGIWQLGEEEQAAAFGNKPGQVHIDAPGMVWDPEYTYTMEVTETDPVTGVETKVNKEYKGSYYKDVTDANGEVTRTYYNRSKTYTISSTDRQILGHKTPDWTIGFHNTFQFYNFDLSMMATMRWGQLQQNKFAGYMSGKNIPDSYDYWTVSNATNAYPSPGAGMSNEAKDALQYIDGSYIKITNITLGYSFPKNILNSLSLSRLRLYATISNPFIWAKDKQLDGVDPNNPEDNFPLYKTMVFGVNVSF